MTAILAQARFAMFKLLMLTAMFAGLVTAQANPNKTFGLNNGRLWNIAPEDFKMGMVIGFGEAVVFRQKGKPLGASETVGERIKALDQFYADPANLAIPIASAHDVCLARVNGEDPDAIAKMVAVARRVIKETNDAPAKPAAGLAKQ